MFYPIYCAGLSGTKTAEEFEFVIVRSWDLNPYRSACVCWEIGSWEEEEGEMRECAARQRDVECIVGFGELLGGEKRSGGDEEGEH